MVVVCPMEAETGLVPGLGAQPIGLGSSCLSGLDQVVSAGNSPILVIGLAGSLTPECKPGDVYSVGSVIDSSGCLFEPSANTPGLSRAVPSVRIACADALVGTPSAKAALANATSAKLVDMESAHVARWCVARGRSWCMVRAVLDGHDESLPSTMGQWCGPNGRLRIHRVLMSLLSNPLLVGYLPWLARARSRAASALREVFS